MFKRFNDLNTASIDFDCHMHTTFSDGYHSMEEMAQKALALNFKTIAFTDHTTKQSVFFQKYFQEIAVLNQKYPITILKGAEASIADFSGNLTCPGQIKKDLDILIASVHRVAVNDKLYRLDAFAPDIAMELEKALSLAAIQKRECSILGHCGGRCIHFFNAFPLEFFEDIIKACAKYDVAFEINSTYHKKYYPHLAKV